MQPDSEDADGRRPLGASLVTTWVMGTMLIVLSTFLAQFPETERAEPAAEQRSMLAFRR